jgi:hypothetical protein
LLAVAVLMLIGPLFGAVRQFRRQVVNAEED